MAFPCGGISISTASRSNWNLEVLIFVEGGKPENPEKNPRSRVENQQQTRVTAVGGECSHPSGGGEVWRCLPDRIAISKCLNENIGGRNALDLLYLKTSLWSSHLWGRDPKAARFYETNPQGRK